MLLSSEKQGKRLGEYRETLKELTNKYPLDKFPFGASQTKIEKELKGISSSSNNSGFKTFDVGGKKYNIPEDQVEEFKKAKGIK